MQRRDRTWTPEEKIIVFLCGVILLIFMVFIVYITLLTGKVKDLEHQLELSNQAVAFHANEHQKTIKAFAESSARKDDQIEKINTRLKELQKQNETLKKNIALSKQIKAAKDKAVRAAALPSRGGFRSGMFRVKATAYTPYCEGCSGTTATGIDLRTGRYKIIAVDPRYIPLNRRWHMWVDGEYRGIWTSADTGGAIKGMKIDVLHYSKSEALSFGRRTVELAPVQ